MNSVPVEVSVFLGIIAFAVLVMAAVQVGVVIVLLRLSRRVDVLATRVETELDPLAERLLAVADNLRQALGSGIVILGRADGDKASILVAVTDDLKAKIGAGDLVKDLAPIIGGGGGGRSDLAEAGGKDPSRLDEALRAGRDAVARRAGASA